MQHFWSPTPQDLKSFSLLYQKKRNSPSPCLNMASGCFQQDGNGASGSPAPRCAHQEWILERVLRVICGGKSETIGGFCPWTGDQGFLISPWHMLLSKCLINTLILSVTLALIPHQPNPHPHSLPKCPSDPVLWLHQTFQHSWFDWSLILLPDTSKYNSFSGLLVNPPLYPDLATMTVAAQ